ncbi:MAG: FtsX-like permease family protein [Planctomycetota bacterium]|nr:FtsX-like permease family protein [Planctomycetota bacterium]
MRTNIALANIRTSFTRTLISVAGIGIAVILIFMQLGFRGAVEDTATTLYGKMDFDLIVRSKDYLHFVDCRTVPQSLVAKIDSNIQAETVTPFYVSMGNWRHPEGKRIRGMVIMGVPPGTSPFNEPEVESRLGRLTSPRYILVDRKTHHEFGPRDGNKFSDLDLGVVTNLNGRTVEIVGHFDIGAGLTANGSMITSERGFANLVPIDTARETSMVLVKLKKDTPPELAAERIRKLLSDQDHAQVLTRKQVIRAELTRWIDQTPLGFVFTLGVAVSFIVGSAIVFMVLSNDVSNRLPEYATLKAMGYTNWYLSGIVLKQATYLAVFSFVPGLVLSILLYQLTSILANISISMTGVRAMAVFGLSIVMCWVSGFGALKKLCKAEPASLF